MLFNTPEFAVFLAAVLLAFTWLPDRGRNPLLLGASLVFYTLWFPAYLLLLLVDVGVNYLLLRAMRRSPRPRVWLALSVGFTLGLLAFFKYAAFLVESSLPVLTGVLGITPAVPDFFLPLGISFYSFQIVALAVDTCRGRIEPVGSLSRYALFVCFFPQLIAGPILRGFQFLPQLERGPRPDASKRRRGLWLLASGLAKKVVLADFLLGPFVDQIFADPGVGSAPFHWVAAYSFAFKIYFDFSGYTDMARGIALLLGFELPWNFEEPYLSRNPAEFWRRWHITLSTWLRDYLYIPLGGNRRGSTRTQVNLMITMLLGGLWHGASWNFVIWGGLHGMLLVAHRLALRGSGDPEQPLRLSDAPRILLLFHAMCVLWVFFRAPTLELAWRFIQAMFTGGDSSGWPLLPTLTVVLCFGLHVLERFVRTRLPAWQERLARAWWGPALEGSALGLLAAVVFAVSGESAEFIYFQF